MGPLEGPHSALCFLKTICLERASIDTCHCPLLYTIYPINPFHDKWLKKQHSKNLFNFLENTLEGKKSKIHTFFTQYAQQIQQFVKYHGIRYHLPPRATLKNAEIFTYPSIHRFGCVANCGATPAPGIGYYFLGGSLQFSSLIESLRLMTTRCF